MKLVRGALALCSASLLFACENVDSVNVRTDGIYADYVVTADGSGEAELKASLRVGGSKSNTFLDLIDGDQLMADHNGKVREMDRQSHLFGAITYRTSYDDADAEGTLFRIAFERRPHSESEAECRGGSAPNSTATLPAKFEITSPEEDTKFSRSDDDIVVRWDADDKGDTMRIRTGGSCVDDQWFDVGSDVGEFTIKKGRLVELFDDDPRCRFDIDVYRERAGSVDGAFGEGGKFVAQQKRTIRLRSVP